MNIRVIAAIAAGASACISSIITQKVIKHKKEKEESKLREYEENLFKVVDYDPIGIKGKTLEELQNGNEVISFTLHM